MASQSSQNRPFRVAHVISGLEVGGAERVLQRLCQEHRRQGLCDPVVISLGSEGQIGAELLAQGFTVKALNIGLSKHPIAAVRSLRAALQALNPDLVQSWLYHSDLLAGLALRGSGLDCPLVWNLRCSAPGSSRTTQAIMWFNSALSRLLPRSIICCGESAQRYHAARGYDRGRMVVIPNGFDIGAFTPGTGAGQNGCRFLAIGRDDALKDYPTLIRALAVVAADDPGASLTICGRGIPESAANKQLIAELGLEQRITLQSQVSDVRPALGAADVYCSSSTSEGFPNVIGEAMLMELPCVVTDAGDSAVIVGACGTVVSPSNPAALGQAMLAMARMPVEARRELGKAGRQRIERDFAIDHIARRYADHYRTLLNERKA